MKAAPLIVNWHEDTSPIYSVHFEAGGKGRLATGGGDNKVRIWKVEHAAEERKVTYLSTLSKHTQAVNVVRFSPKGEVLASGGDDGNVLLWIPSDGSYPRAIGEEDLGDLEHWRVKHMCRTPSASEIYDLAWSPDATFFILGSMDNCARIYNAQTGSLVRQIAEHNHFVQGVAWDPLNEFIATQSSDRTTHVWRLRNHDGEFSLSEHGKFSKMNLPSRRISSHSPAPPELGRGRPPRLSEASLAMASPGPSMPGTPTSSATPMHPPASAIPHSRRTSISSSPSMRRSLSPAPSMPLPAVRPMDSPKMHAGLGVRNSSLYASEAQTTFFRRLTFAPDGSLLFTPAGQFSVRHPQGLAPDSRAYDEVLNTVYIYTRAGFNKPPVAHLPGHKKPSIAVRCCPTYFTLRNSGNATKHITIDTSSKAYALDALSPPATNPSSSANNAMEPPAVPPFRPSTPSLDHASPRKNSDTDVNSSSGAPGPTPGFSMPYRIVYAVASQDTVFVYDTQQMIPITTVSNLHFSTFTDLAWSNDGLTLIMSSSDGFCSALTFTAGELGQAFTGPTGRAAMTPANNTPVPLNLSGASPSATSSTHSTPLPTPVTSQGHHPHQHPSRTSFTSQTSMPSPSFLPRDTPATIPSSFSTSLSSASSQHHPLHHRSHSSNRPPSPTRSNSTSSIATLNNPVLSIGSLPGVGISSATMASPPQTPAGSVLGKRDAEQVVRDEMGASASTAGSGLGSGGAGGGGGLGISGVKRRRVGDGGAEGGSVSGAE